MGNDYRRITTIAPTIASLSPTTSGTHTITGCFGVICTDYVLQIEPGTPVELFASFSPTIDLGYIEFMRMIMYRFHLMLLINMVILYPLK